MWRDDQHFTLLLHDFSAAGALVELTSKKESSVYFLGPRAR